MVIKFSCSESRFLKMGVSKLTKLISEAKASKDTITLEATVITGFEPQAVDECREKCKPANVFSGKGRIFFNIKKDSYPNIFRLRSVDNVYIVNESFDTIEFTRNKEEDMEIIKNLVAKVDWIKCVPQWAELTGFKGVQFPKCAKRVPIEPLAEGEPTCQRCLAPLKPPDIVPSEGAPSSQKCEVDQSHGDSNPIILLDEPDSPKLLADCDKAEFVTVPEIDRSKITAQNLDSDDDANFHSAEENGVEAENYVDKVGGTGSVPVIKTIEASKCTLDSPSGNEVSELIKDLPVQSKEVTHAPDEDMAAQYLPSNVTEEEMANDEAAVEELCLESELLSVSGDAAALKNEENRANETKRGKKMSHWKRQREEQKRRGKGKKRVAKPPPKPYIDDGIIKFRVTCYRNGKKHSFDSNDAAMHFGGSINDEFHWTVDLTRWDINVVLVIEDDSGYVTFGLTKESLHRRNISHFGPTTLRSTLCYSLIRFAEPRNGDIVIDPMCGGGSISIEGAKGFPKTFHICGDYNEKSVGRTKENLLFNTKTEPLNMDAFRWDAKCLPLKDQSVDVLVTDLPFGLRMGKWKDNYTLYGAVLRELARVIRSGTGRAALLTYDRAAMYKALRNSSDLWREIRSVTVNHGGIKCVVFLLLRKALKIADKIDEDIGGKLDELSEKDGSVQVADDAAGLHESTASSPSEAPLNERSPSQELITPFKEPESVHSSSEESKTP